MASSTSPRAPWRRATSPLSIPPTVRSVLRIFITSSVRGPPSSVSFTCAISVRSRCSANGFDCGITQ